MSLIVQKFGGTSVATPEARKLVVDKIIEKKKNGDKVVVVVSAMGRKGNPYATDTIINMVSNLLPREMDLLMSCGELISAAVLVDELLKNGHDASVLTGGQAGITTNENYMSADVLSVNPKEIFDLLGNDIIPVVTGFQGMSDYGNITTLGRGGSDTSAALIGEAIDSDEIQIFTDVDGIMTADPRMCPHAKVIDNISYNEVFQMADSGAKVIHPRAVEVARRAGIPLKIKNTFNDTEGSIIKYCAKTKGIVLEGDTGKIITSIAHINERVQFRITGDNINNADLYDQLAKAGVSIDIINIFTSHSVFTVHENMRQNVEKILNENKIEYDFIKGCSKVTLIGERMTGVPGVMAKIIGALQSEGIEILQTADSLTTIACLVYTNKVEHTIKTLHQVFRLEV